MSAFVDRLCLEEGKEVEQTLSDKTEIDLKMDFKMMGYGNNVEGDATLDKKWNQCMSYKVKEWLG